VSIDRAKVLTIAQKYLVKGQMDKAITEYEKLLKDDPKDVRTLLKIGDIHARKGDTKEACATYQAVATQYAEQGFFQKAVAVYKQILVLDPNRREILEKLGEMYKLLNLTSDAIATYEQIFAASTESGDTQRALEVLREIAQLEPQNAISWLRYAEALSAGKRTDEALRFYETAAGLLKGEGRIDDFIKVAERIAFHRPGDANLACEIAELYLNKGDTRSALVKLQLSFRVNPTDVRTLELLARGFQQLGQNSKTVSVYKEIARLHEEAKRAKPQEQVAKKGLEQNAHDSEVAVPLESVSSETSSPPPAAPVALSPPFPSETPGQPSEARPESSRSSSFPTVDPISVGSAGAIPPLPPVAPTLPVAGLTSGPPAYSSVPTRPPTEPGVGAVSSAARAAFASQGARLPEDYEEDEEVFFIEESSSDDQASTDLPNQTAEYEQSAKVIAASVPPSSPAFTPNGGEISEQASTDLLPSAAPVPIEKDKPQGSEVPREVADVLEEAQFYFAQRLVTEAYGTLTDAISRHPDQPALLSLLQEVEKEKVARRSVQPAPVESRGPEAPPSASPRESIQAGVPESHRPEPAPSVSTTEGHYERGIAYMEMDLHDNAIKEFRASLENRELECVAHTMIGLCYVAKGEAKEGLKHFNLGLAAPSRTDTEEIGLLYEIGNTYEILKMPKEALGSFENVAALDPEFRNVKQRIERLASPENIDDDLSDLDKLFDEIIIKE
jgi:tetratricopeptide (TPR) repeat protein